MTILLGEVLDSCRYVVEQAKYARINHQKIREVAKDLEVSGGTHWLKSSPFNILDFDVKTLVDFLLTYHAMGFSFWGDPKWTIDTPDGKSDGSYALLYALVRQVRSDDDFLLPSNLRKISFAKMREILKGNVEIPLLELRHANLVQVGKVVDEKMGGDFYRYIMDIHRDSDLLDLVVDSFEFFRDACRYKGRTICFYKLAQVLVSDILRGRALKEKIKADWTHLTGCADYKLPQILRSLGVLEYCERLKSLVDNKIEIDGGSSYEVEIRASTLVAIDEIKRQLDGRVCAMAISECLWLMGQDKSRVREPYHLTRTGFY